MGNKRNKLIHITWPTICSLGVPNSYMLFMLFLTFNIYLYISSLSLCIYPYVFLSPYSLSHTGNFHFYFYRFLSIRRHIKFQGKKVIGWHQFWQAQFFVARCVIAFQTLDKEVFSLQTLYKEVFSFETDKEEKGLWFDFLTSIIRTSFI